MTSRIETPDPNNPEHVKLFDAAHRAGHKLYSKSGSGFLFTPIDHPDAKHLKIEHHDVSKFPMVSDKDFDTSGREPYPHVSDWEHTFHPDKSEGTGSLFGMSIVHAHAKHSDEKGNLYLHDYGHGIRVIHGDKSKSLQRYNAHMKSLSLVKQYDYQE